MSCLAQLTKRKYALLIGINYRGTDAELEGCINDVNNVKNMLVSNYGYSSKYITIITDDTKIQPLREEILKAMRNHVAKAKNGDILYIHYSGHGYYDRNWGPDKEIDGNDELICPLDDPISDNELNQILVQDLGTGVKLRCVFDCCHSGSMMDLPCRLNVNSKIIFENKKFTDKDIVMISGCRDDQTSADAWIERNYTGALTWSFLLVLGHLSNRDEIKNWNWRDFMILVRFYLRQKDFDQVPQLSFAQQDREKEIVTI